MTNNIVDTQFQQSLSFVVPVKDEEATLVTLFRGIAAQATNLTSHWEVIFIDDGSSDGSWKVIRQLAAEGEEHVKAIGSGETSARRRLWPLGGRNAGATLSLRWMPTCRMTRKKFRGSWRK
jgi:cellulose synthase/poly-beta-1,6-N-acetylglucosamine synthase-like glycosyltransferase